MNVPAIAKKTYEELKLQPEFKAILNFVVDTLNKISDVYQRAQFIHKVIDEYNEDIFTHPLVKQYSPCKIGCTGCCHTQVSVTDDEAELLLRRIKNGAKINHERLRIQMKADNDPESFYKIKYEDRKCVFLSDEGSCGVYEDRPSVCRTNAVLGSADQCDTSVSIKPTRLVRTPKSDITIYASFLFSKTSGSLPHMIGKLLKK